MKIQLASDLHFEVLAAAFPGDAGDIAVGAKAVQLFADSPVPVLYVAGNHEFYGRDIDDVEAQLRHAAEARRFVSLRRTWSC